MRGKHRPLQRRAKPDPQRHQSLWDAADRLAPAHWLPLKWGPRPPRLTTLQLQDAADAAASDRRDAFLQLGQSGLWEPAKEGRTVVQPPADAP
ncbi:hypothetical protein [Mumia zhuanghuii]|uniref:Uncharacterized protein n=1 Tax=Mumia zhuanghuii TaxID=2585211 RepID=A0A5C4M1Q9_9ACTN|nr:hypothetical protein [Mumia zhuanghuii]TNC26847.1 hypothetical protein FHE65_34470 [Mumia zhuanghuii]